MQFDLSLEELRRYRPAVDEPGDFDEYWAERRGRSDGVPARRRGTVPPTASSRRSTFSTSASPATAGHASPRGCSCRRTSTADTPVVVEFVGYGGGRGRPAEWLNWSCAGFPHLVMDSRGQGGGWRGADTADVGATGEPGARGFLTSGLAAPAAHYYTRLFVDAARALAVPAELPAPRRAATGRRPESARAAGWRWPPPTSTAASPRWRPTCRSCATSVAPWRSPTARRTSRSATTAGCIRTASTRSSPRCRTSTSSTTPAGCDVPALFSVGLADLVTPPSTVFSAFNHYAGDKAIEVYEFNGHDGAATCTSSARSPSSAPCRSDPASRPRCRQRRTSATG